MPPPSQSNHTNGLNQEQKEELANIFKTVDADGNGHITVEELGEALAAVGIKKPGYRVRELVEEYDRNLPGEAGHGKLEIHEFEQLCIRLKAEEVNFKREDLLVPKANIKQNLGNDMIKSAEGTTHSIRNEEQVAFSDWINTNLGRDPDLKHLLPIDVEGNLLYDRVVDGILLCKVINHSCPDTIDERALNKTNLTLYRQYENLMLALSSAQSIGCTVVNIDATDLRKGIPHLVLGLLWQIIRIGLFNQIDLQHCPGLVQLVGPDEKLEDVMRLSPEQILLRWVNYHLERAGVAKRINNFTSDIKDSEAYIYLLSQIAPKECGVTTSPIYERDLESRAELMLQEADKISCRAFLSARDVTQGNYKLNIAFTANLFNTHPGLDLPEDLGEIEGGGVQETREEKTYRNWMNSMGVDPYVNHLYSDLCTGLIIFQLYDVIRPKIVEWDKVHKKFNKLRGFMQKIENCNYAVELGKALKFSLVGIGGQDINDGNETLTLALVWQLMRAYTLSILTKLAGTGQPIIEKEIIRWANDKLAASKKEKRIQSFQDPQISDGTVILDLIDSIKPGSVSYDMITEDKLANAKYAISLARKTGARIYALPEDIVEVKPKMVMTVFACLMGRDYRPEMGTAEVEANVTPVTGEE